MLLATLLFFNPARVTAIPISEYQQNLKNAVSSLESLLEIDKEEITVDYDSRLNETLRDIRSTLPPKQTVESDGDVCNVDNEWLHRALDELQQEPDPQERLEQMVASLRAMESRVAEHQDQTQTLESKDAAKSRLQTILARPEYVTTAQGPNALMRLMRDLIAWLKKLLPDFEPAQPGSVAWLELVAKILVGLSALALFIFLSKLLLNRFKRSRKIRPPKKKQPRIVLGERLEPEQTAADLLSEAEALARSGDLRAAIRKAYIALLVELGDRKIISLAQHKTNRDYLNALRDLPPLHSSMRGLTDSFERHWYGFAEANLSDWQNFREGYLAALHRGN